MCGSFFGLCCYLNCRYSKGCCCLMVGIVHVHCYWSIVFVVWMLGIVICFTLDLPLCKYHEDFISGLHRSRQLHFFLACQLWSSSFKSIIWRLDYMIINSPPTFLIRTSSNYDWYDNMYSCVVYYFEQNDM